jgi:hypothetical protein
MVVVYQKVLETNPSIDVNFSDAVTGKQGKMWDLTSPQYILMR